MTMDHEAGTPGPDPDIDHHLTDLIATMEAYHRLLQKRCDALRAEGADGTGRDKDLRELMSAVQAVLKEKGRLRDDQRKLRDADGGPGLDLDAARAEVECRMARLREQACARRAAEGDGDA